MEGKLQLSVRTATRDRQAKIATPFDATVGEILASARDNWNLSGDYEYVLSCERLGSQLAENMTLSQAGVREGDVLEIQPLADAG
jgi:hypothetical protein